MTQEIVEELELTQLVACGKQQPGTKVSVSIWGQAHGKRIWKRSRGFDSRDYRFALLRLPAAGL
jgi:hypothetical protein